MLPLVEGVVVDYHTREKISHSGKRIPLNPFFFKSVTTAEKTAADEENSGSLLVSISHF